MALFDELDRRRHVLRHAQPRHHDAQSPPRQPRHPDFALHVAEFGRAGGGEDADGVEFFQHEGFDLEADGVGGGEGREGVGELAEGAADPWGAFG